MKGGHQEFTVDNVRFWDDIQTEPASQAPEYFDLVLFITACIFYHCSLNPWQKKISYISKKIKFNLHAFIFFYWFFCVLFSWSYSYIAKIQINYTISVNHRRKIFQGKTSANWKINCMSCPFLQNIQQTQKNVSYVKFWCICLFKKKEINFFKMWSFTKSWSIMGEALRNSFVISSLLLAPSLSDRLFT